MSTAAAAATSSTPFPAPFIIPTYPKPVGYSLNNLLDKAYKVGITRLALLAASIVAAAATIAVGFTAIPLLAIIPGVICAGTLAAYFLIKKIIPYVIIAFDGGGERGIIIAKLIALIEESLNNTIAETLSGLCLIGGTSVGSILAATLTKRDPVTPGRAQFGGLEMVRFFREQGPEIFPRVSILDTGLVTPKFSPEPLRQALTEKFNDEPLNPLEGTSVVIPSFSIMSHKLHDIVYPSPNPAKAVDAIMASTAAPAYFPPHPIGNDNFIDGGVQANNPTGRAYAVYRKQYPSKPHAVFVLSFDTGSFPAAPITYEQSRSWGTLPFLTHGLIDDILEAQPTECDALFRILAEEGVVAGYHRVTVDLTQAADLADARPKTIAELEARAEALFNAWKDYLMRDLIMPLRVFRQRAGLPAL